MEKRAWKLKYDHRSNDSFGGSIERKEERNSEIMKRCIERRWWTRLSSNKEVRIAGREEWK